MSHLVPEFESDLAKATSVYEYQRSLPSHDDYQADSSRNETPTSYRFCSKPFLSSISHYPEQLLNNSAECVSNTPPAASGALSQQIPTGLQPTQASPLSYQPLSPTECISDTLTIHRDYGFHGPSALVSGRAQPSMMSSQSGDAFRSPNAGVNQQPYQQEQYQPFQDNSGPATYEGFQNDPIELAPGVLSQQSSVIVTGLQPPIQGSTHQQVRVQPSSPELDPEIDDQLRHSATTTSQLKQRFQKACFVSGNEHLSIPSNEPRENQSVGENRETLTTLEEENVSKEPKQPGEQLCSNYKAKTIQVQSEKIIAAAVIQNSSVFQTGDSSETTSEQLTQRRTLSTSTTASSYHTDSDPGPLSATPPDCDYRYYRRLFENLNSPHAVSVLTKINNSSVSRKNFAAKLNKKLFSDKIRRTSNVRGVRKKNQLDKKWIGIIKTIVFKYRPLKPDETEDKACRNCVVAIDTANRQPR